MGTFCVTSILGLRKSMLFSLLHLSFYGTVEPRYNEVLGTMKITLLYQVSHNIRVKKQRNIKSWDQQNYLVTCIRGFCYIRPLYNEVPLYCNILQLVNTNYGVIMVYLFCCHNVQTNFLAYSPGYGVFPFVAISMSRMPNDQTSDLMLNRP